MAMNLTSNQPGQYLSRHFIPQLRKPLQQPRNISQILLPLAAAPRWVLKGPNLASQNVRHGRHWERQPQHLAIGGPLRKSRVTGVGLNLQAQA